MIEEHPDKQSFINVQIELYTNHKNYVQAFKCLLQSKSQQERVFSWINEFIEELQHDQEQCDSLKVAVKVHMYDIATLEIELSKEKQKEKALLPLKIQSGENIAEKYLARDSDLFCKGTVGLIETYFSDGDYLQNLITKDFADLDKVQLHFLKTYVVLKQHQIADTIHDVIEQPTL